jgi:hypothetical protein
LFILIIQPSHLYLPSSIFPHLLNFLRYSFRLAHLLTLLTSHLLSLHLLFFFIPNSAFPIPNSIASQPPSFFLCSRHCSLLWFICLIYLYLKFFPLLSIKYLSLFPLFSQQSRHDPVTAHHFRWKLINLCTRT